MKVYAFRVTSGPFNFDDRGCFSTKEKALQAFEEWRLETIATLEKNLVEYATIVPEENQRQYFEFALENDTYLLDTLKKHDDIEKLADTLDSLDYPVPFIIEIDVK